MNYEALKYKIGITLIKGIGNNLAKNLIAYLGSEEAVFGEKQQNLAKIPGIGEVLSREIVKQDVLRRAEEEVEFVVKNKITPYYFSDREYPFRLKECPDAPIMIYTKDIVQDLVDEWNIEWVDEIDRSHITDTDFVYNIRRIEGNKDWQILVDFILPNVGTYL